jgi:hypothetical protein
MSPSGDVVGTLELKARMDEDFRSLFGSRPYACPSPPPVDLNMMLFGVHMTRVFSLIEDIRGVFEFYGYLVSWRHPVVTLASLAFFAYSTYHFDAEYIGSFPFACLALGMLYLAIARWRGRLRKRLLDKEDEVHRKVSYSSRFVCVKLIETV